MHIRPAARGTAAAISLRTYKRELAIGLALGLGIGGFLKYVAAALLICWLLVGGQ